MADSGALTAKVASAKLPKSEPAGSFERTAARQSVSIAKIMASDIVNGFISDVIKMVSATRDFSLQSTRPQFINKTTLSKKGIVMMLIAINESANPCMRHWNILDRALHKGMSPGREERSGERHQLSQKPVERLLSSIPVRTDPVFRFRQPPVNIPASDRSRCLLVTRGVVQHFGCSLAETVRRAATFSPFNP